MAALFYKNGFPVETPEAQRFWASRHKSNRMKAIIAFSVDKASALNNLRRYGYSRAWRNKAWVAYSKYVNDPAMLTTHYSTTSEPYWLWK